MLPRPPTDTFHQKSNVNLNLAINPEDTEGHDNAESRRSSSVPASATEGYQTSTTLKTLPRRSRTKQGHAAGLRKIATT